MFDSIRFTVVKKETNKHKNGLREAVPFTLGHTAFDDNLGSDLGILGPGTVVTMEGAEIRIQGASVNVV